MGPTVNNFKLLRTLKVPYEFVWERQVIPVTANVVHFLQ